MNKEIKVNDKTKEEMIKYYKDKMKDKKIPYVIFQAVDEDTVITMYESGKVMFQGKSADVDASHWAMLEETTEQKPNTNDKKYYYVDAVGSDEVGTGDYFGPIVVTSSYVSKEDIPYLEELGVGDSKKIDDEKIKKIAPLIAKKIKYKSLILRNEEYKEKYGIGTNMNQIKAIMHNKVLYQMMQEENPKIDYIIVDEFAKEIRYYNYLKGINNIQRGITFMTKAEDKNMAVACSSIISRYRLLKEFDKMSDFYHRPFLKGASRDVDKIGEEFVERYGEEKLKEVAKLNFKNTERVLHTLIY